MLVEELGGLTTLLVVRDVQTRDRRHLALEELSERHGRAECLVKPDEDVAESADVSLAAHPNRLVTLFPEATIQFRAELGVGSIDLGHDTAKDPSIEIVILLSTTYGSEPAMNVVECPEDVPPCDWTIEAQPRLRD